MSQYQIGDYKKFYQENDKQGNFYCFTEKYKRDYLSLTWAIFHFGHN